MKTRSMDSPQRTPTPMSKVRVKSVETGLPAEPTRTAIELEADPTMFPSRGDVQATAKAVKSKVAIPAPTSGTV